MCFLAFVLAVAGCSKPPAQPTDPTCTIKSPSGEVLIQAAGTGSWVEAIEGMMLAENDTVKTGADGQVMLLFFDGSTMEIEADSEVVVNELSVADDTGSTTVRLGHVVGRTVNRVENLADPASRYEVETPAGVAVVRGTLFNSDVEEDGNTTIGCQDGGVWFTAGGKEVLVEKGKQSKASPGGTPSDPTPIPSYVGDLHIENVKLCSEVTPQGNCTCREDGVFSLGETVWVYLEGHDLSWHEDSGSYEAWFRITSVEVYDPNGFPYLSGGGPIDSHSSGLKEPPDFLWGAIHFELLPDRSIGQYEGTITIEDVISGATDSVTIELEVEGEATG